MVHTYYAGSYRESDKANATHDMEENSSGCIGESWEKPNHFDAVVA